MTDTTAVNNTNNKNKMDDNSTNRAERDSRNTSTMKVVAPPAGFASR